MKRKMLITGLTGLALLVLLLAQFGVLSWCAMLLYNWGGVRARAVRGAAWRRKDGSGWSASATT